MDLLLVHRQEKRDSKSSATSICDLKLYSDDNNIEYVGTFEFDYHRYGEKKHVTFIHKFNLNIKSGDIVVWYTIDNDNLTKENSFKSNTISKKNSFGLLFDLTESGLYRGEKRAKFWGVKYERATQQVFDVVYGKLSHYFKCDFIKDKLYGEKSTINPLYDLLVDYHLDLKEIKSHDGVYHDIKYDYPKKKYLKQNENKFLSAVLDSYSIKSRYLIGELNKNAGKPIHISSLNYLCKLFGSNYIDYIKKIKWENHCYDLPTNKKIHELKNESEKKSMVQLINNWERDTLKSDSFLYNVNKLLTIREQLESKGLDLKFKAKDDHEFENILETWSGIKKHFARGFKLRYVFPDDFINYIQEPIEVDGETYDVKLLTTEEEFRLEGYTMKNCMSKQFPYGSYYIFTALSNKKKRVNIQYRKGNLTQQYGKTNTPVPDSFTSAVTILTERVKKYATIEWKKEKYDFL